MKYRIAIFFPIFVLLALAGCATSPHGANLPAPVKSDRLASLDFNFILVNTTCSSPDLEADTSLLKDSILSGLRETGLFPDVGDMATNGLAGGGIKIVASIKQITKVSDHSRVWFGGLAGHAEVVVQVNVSDLTTGRPVELFEADGSTGASAWAGTTKEAIQQAATKVAAEIANLDSQAAQQLIQK